MTEHRLVVFVTSVLLRTTACDFSAFQVSPPARPVVSARLINKLRHPRRSAPNPWMTNPALALNGPSLRLRRVDKHSYAYTYLPRYITSKRFLLAAERVTSTFSPDHPPHYLLPVLTPHSNSNSKNSCLLPSSSSSAQAQTSATMSRRRSPRAATKSPSPRAQ